MYLFEIVVEVPAVEAAGGERAVGFGGVVQVVDVDVGVVYDDGLRHWRR